MIELVIDDSIMHGQNLFPKMKKVKINNPYEQCDIDIPPPLYSSNRLSQSPQVFPDGSLDRFYIHGSIA